MIKKLTHIFISLFSAVVIMLSSVTAGDSVFYSSPLSVTNTGNSSSQPEFIAESGNAAVSDVKALTDSELSSAPQSEEISADDVLPSSGKVTQVSSNSAAKSGENIIPAKVNNIMRDTLSSSVVTNVYTFTVMERGLVMYSFAHVDATDDDCNWEITLFEEYSPDGSDSSTAYRELNTLEYSKIGTKVTSSQFGLLPGNYRIKVKCVTGYTNGKYDLTLGFSSSDGYETEYNDSANRYTYLPLNKTLSGCSANYSDGTLDEDWFMFEVTETGYTVLYFDHAASLSTTTPGTSVGWILIVTDIDGNEYLNTKISLQTTSVSSGVMGLAPGCYFATVYSHVYDAAQYTISAQFSHDEAIEKEFNDSPETATPIEINTQTVGSLSARDSTSDVDYFTFTMKEKGVVIFDFMHEKLTDDHDGWNISLIAADGTVLYKTTSNWTDSVIQSPYIGLDKGTYYLKIDSDNIYLNSIVYNLILLTSSDSAWETELNNTPETADEIAFEQITNGALVEIGTDYDTDWFTFNSDGSTDTYVHFYHAADTTEGEGWIVTLYDGDMNVIGKPLSVAHNKVESVISAGILQQGKYYVCIESGLFFSDTRYIITVSIK